MIEALHPIMRSYTHYPVISQALQSAVRVYGGMPAHQMYLFFIEAPPSRSHACKQGVLLERSAYQGAQGDRSVLLDL